MGGRGGERAQSHPVEKYPMVWATKRCHAVAQSTERWLLGSSSAVSATSTSERPCPDSSFAAHEYNVRRGQRQGLRRRVGVCPTVPGSSIPRQLRTSSTSVVSTSVLSSATSTRIGRAVTVRLRTGPPAAPRSESAARLPHCAPRPGRQTGASAALAARA